MDNAGTITQMTKVENVTNTRISAYPFLVTHSYDAWVSVINEI